MDRSAPATGAAERRSTRAADARRAHPPPTPLLVLVWCCLQHIHRTVPVGLICRGDQRYFSTTKKGAPLIFVFVCSAGGCRR